MQVYAEENYNNVVPRYGCGAAPLNTLCAWVNKVQRNDPLDGYGTNSILSHAQEETILKFIKELKYEVAVIDLDTILALARTVGNVQWAANFCPRYKMGCFKNMTAERLPSAVSDLVLDNKWRRDYLDVVEQPQKYGVSIPEANR